MTIMSDQNIGFMVIALIAVLLILVVIGYAGRYANDRIIESEKHRNKMQEDYDRRREDQKKIEAFYDDVGPLIHEIVLHKFGPIDKMEWECFIKSDLDVDPSTHVRRVDVTKLVLSLDWLVQHGYITKDRQDSVMGWLQGVEHSMLRS